MEVGNPPSGGLTGGGYFGSGYFGKGYSGYGYFGSGIEEVTPSVSSSVDGGYFGGGYFPKGYLGAGYFGSGETDDVVVVPPVPAEICDGTGHYSKGKILNAYKGNYYPFGKKKLRDKKQEAEEELARVEAELLRLQKKESQSWSHFDHIHTLKQDALELLEHVQALDSELDLIRLLNGPELQDRADDAELDEIRKVYEAHLRSKEPA